jgi:hypothetical protein
VSVDGHGLGDTPIRRAAVSPGSHVVLFENDPLGRSIEHTVRVESGETVTLSADLETSPPTVRER